MNAIINAAKKETGMFCYSVAMVILTIIMLQFTIGVWFIQVGIVIGTMYFGIIMFHKFIRPVHYLVEAIIYNSKSYTSPESFWITMWSCTAAAFIIIFMGHFWIGVLNLLNLLAMSWTLKPIEVKE